MKKNPNIEVELCGIKFRNPVLTAAGPPVRNGEAILRCADGGAGGIVTKTISTKKAKPPLPCMAEIRGGFINTELWSELSPNRWLKKEYKIAKSCGLPLIISIGYSSEQISNLAPKVAKYADGLELSTHYIEPKDMVETIKTAKEIFSPVFVKFSPNITDIALFAKYAENAGADGIVAINSFGPCLSIDIENKMVMMGGTGYGWLSGQAIRPIALRFVYEIAKNVKIPVIGVGGIYSGEDAVEFIMAGASAVQICTAAILKGPKIFGQVAQELRKFLENHGYGSIDDIKGIALKRKAKKLVPIVNENCTGCGLCESSCPYGAIKIEKIAKIDEKKCFGCGLCVSRCRKTWVKALRFE